MDRLFLDCERLGISGEAIAAEASKRSQRGSVKPATVSNVKAHRRKSATVVQAAIVLRDAALAEAVVA